MRDARMILLAILLLVLGCSGLPDQPNASPSPPDRETAAAQADDGGRKQAEASTRGSAAKDEDLAPLHGVPFTGPTNIRLIDGNSMIDLDRRTRRVVTGMPKGAGWAISTFRVGRDIALNVGGCPATEPECKEPQRVFVLPYGSTQATLVATDAWGAPAPDGIWLSRQMGDTCTLAKVGTSGAVLQRARSLDCTISVREETPRGLLARVSGNLDRHAGAILDPKDLRELVGADGEIHAVAGSRMVLADRGGFVVVDASGSRKRVESPASIGSPSDGQVSPDGRYVAISYEHPAWPGPRQRLDVWVLDLETMEWLHVPSMPTAAALKETTEFWAPDGRLVVVGWFETTGYALASWTPGEPDLKIRKLDPPKSPVLASAW